MAIGTLVAFWAVSFLLVLVPGPDWAYAIASGLRDLSFLPQFLTHGAAWPFAAQIALLGLVHTANCAVVYTSVGATAGRVLRARPAAATAVTRCSGAAMIAIGALLLAEHLLT